MKCPDNGLIQAYIDCELDITKKKELEFHFKNCKDCLEKYENMKEIDSFVFSKISSYKEYTNNFDFPDSLNLSKQKKYKELIKMITLKYKRLAVAVSLCIIATIMFAVQPVRGAVGEFLNVFRTEDVSMLKLNINNLKDIEKQLKNKSPEITIDGLGKISTTGGKTKKATLEEVKNIENISIKTPELLSNIKPEVHIHEKTKFDFTLNTDSANNLLKNIGSKKFLPDSVDGKTISIDIPESINLKYFDGEKNFSIKQTKLPSVIVPSNVNVEEIHEILIDLPIIPDDLKSKIKSIKDWKNTLYIPISDKLESKEILINNCKAYINSFTKKSSNEIYYNTIWVEDNTIYSVANNNPGGKKNILNISNSMKK